MVLTRGSIGLALLDDEYIQNPYPLYEQMHAHGEIHQIGDSSFYAVSSWNAVSETVGRVGDFSSNLTATLMRQSDGTIGAFSMDPVGGPTHVLATADDPGHAAHRKMLLSQLAAKRIRALESMVADTTDELWRAGVHDGGVEWMAAMANRLPMMVVGRLIGVPDADVDQLVKWGYASTQLLEGLSDEDALAAAGVAVMELTGYINEQFERAAADPQDNLLGDLAKACAANELDGIAAQIMMITLFSAGGESTASLIGSAAHLLASRHDIQQQLRGNPSLLGTFLEEALRYEPPFRGHYRHVLRDTTLAGAELPAGSHLLLLWGAANRDAHQFDDSDQFRLDRPGGKGHISFGKGAHFCVGAALARLEAKIVIGELLRRTTTVTADDIGEWLPSLLVRRLARLDLAIEGREGREG